MKYSLVPCCQSVVLLEKKNLQLNDPNVYKHFFVAVDFQH